MIEPMDDRQQRAMQAKAIFASLLAIDQIWVEAATELLVDVVPGMVLDQLSSRTQSDRAELYSLREQIRNERNPQTPTEAERHESRHGAVVVSISQGFLARRRQVPNRHRAPDGTPQGRKRP